MADEKPTYEEMRLALANCVLALRLWGAQEDGIPEDGPIGIAYDQAQELLKRAVRGNGAR